MTAPRIEADLTKIRHNARHLVDRLARRGITVTGVTKGVCGHPDIARAMLDGGITRLADARVSNVERMRAAGIDVPIVLIRTPMRSQTDRIVRVCGTSLNTDFGIIDALARSARRASRIHRIVLMVEMGDGREGVWPAEVASLARRVMGLRGVALAGIGANFACLSGRAPDRAALEEFSALAAAIERDCGIALEIVSGGNSANLAGLSGAGSHMRVNDLRLGEAILLGRDPITGTPIEDLFTDAFVLVGEIIESAAEPPPPCLNERPVVLRTAMEEGGVGTSLLALGDQDTDTGGLSMPVGLMLLGSTSDHLLLRTAGATLIVGTEIRFQPNYSALMRAMSAPDVATVIRNRPPPERPVPDRDRQPALELVMSDNQVVRRPRRLTLYKLG